VSTAKKKPASKAVATVKTSAAKGARSKTPATAKVVEPVKSVRVSRQQAMQRFLDATIALLDVKPIPEISLQEIADATGLNHGYVFRYFGTRLDLFSAVTDELARLGVEAGFKEMERRRNKGEDPRPLNLDVLGKARRYTVKRIQVIQYLVLSGVEPERFSEKSRELISKVEEQFQTMGMTPRMAQAQAVKASVLLWSQATLLDILGVTPEEASDVQAMSIDGIINHKATTKRLGWK
jgi:AcrR family transcriptional regulator